MSGSSSYNLLRDYLDTAERCQFLKWQQRKYRREDDKPALEDVDKELGDCQQQCNAALSLINLFNGYEATLLKLRFIQGMSVKAIAASSELPYGYDWVSHKLGEQRHTLDFLDRWKAAQV